MRIFSPLKNQIAVVLILSCAGLLFGLYFSVTAVKRITLISNDTKDVKGADEIQAENNIITPTLNGAGAQTKPNLTASLSQKLIEALNSKNQDGFLNQDPKEALKMINGQDLGGIIKELAAENSIGALRSIPNSEIRWAASDDRDSGLTYINDVARLASENLNTTSLNKDPIDALDLAINSENFASLAPAADAYAKIADGLKTISVPKSWGHVHKELITYFDLMSRVFNSVSQADNDPLGAMMGLGILDDTMKMRLETNQKIQQLMSRQKINFAL